MTENINLFHGDCLEVMDKLIKRGVKVDAIICDPPYGTTACKWDSIIPLDEMVGDQKLALIKANSVRGLKIVISELDSEFVISSIMNVMRVKY